MAKATASHRSRGKTAPDSNAIGLRHIAEELKVSISLVSKVLNGRLGTSGASEEMICAIRKKAESLHYRKNRQAEALRTGQQNVIAVCIHRQGESGSGIAEDMVSGIAREAAIHQQRLILQYYQTPDEFRAFAPELHRNAADGVIVAGYQHPELIDELAAMQERGLPVITIHDQPMSASFPNVGMDQQEVGRHGTLHLIEQGCRRIAHVVGGHDSVAQARHQGYRRALRDAGLAYHAELLMHVGNFGYESGQEAINRLLEAGAKFDGIVGQSDHHAAAALNGLISRGVSVPQQVKLIGVDDAAFCRFVIVPLSSVSQEFHARGRLAMQMLAPGAKRAALKAMNVTPVVRARESSAI
jgi:LacI family transcriptional regulator